VPPISYARTTNTNTNTNSTATQSDMMNVFQRIPTAMDVEINVLHVCCDA